jgi:hypothetical protein
VCRYVNHLSVAARRIERIIRAGAHIGTGLPFLDRRYIAFGGGGDMRRAAMLGWLIW